MQFIWKAELPDYEGFELNSLNQTFNDEINELLQQSEGKEFSVQEFSKGQDFATSNIVEFDFDKLAGADQKGLKKVGSRWYRWTFAVFSTLRKQSNSDSAVNIPLPKVTFNDQDLQFYVKDVTTRFTRYERKRFWLFRIELNNQQQLSTTNVDEIFALQRQLAEVLNKQFTTIKTARFIVTDKFEDYKEVLQVMNPAPILSRTEFDSLEESTIPSDKVIGPDYQRHYRKYYWGQERWRATSHTCSPIIVDEHAKPHKDDIEVHVRELQTLYVIDNNTQLADGHYSISKSSSSTNKELHPERSGFIDRYHTEQLFFIRGSHYEKNLAPLYRKIEFLNRVSAFMKDHWVKIRSLYAVTPKFATLGNNLSARIMFFLLEVNAHLLGMFTKVKFDFSSLDQKLSEELERPMFNIEQNRGTEDELRYYRFLTQTARKSYDVYHNKLSMAEEYSDRIDANIQKLHADFDSKSNMVLQTLVFIFSAIFVLWGAYEVWLDKIFSDINYQTLTTIGYFLSWSGGGLLTLFGLYLITSKFFLASTSFSFDNTARALIRQWLCTSADCSVDKKSTDQLRALIRHDIRTSPFVSDTIEKSLQLCTLGIIGVSTNNLAESDVEHMLDTIDEIIPSKKMETRSPLKNRWQRFKARFHKK